MKKLLLMASCCFAIASCSKPETKQQKAERLVKLYLDSTLNDPKSYQAVKFEKLDTIKSNIALDKNYIGVLDKLDRLMKEENDASGLATTSSTISEINALEKNMKEIVDSAKNAENEQEAMVKKFKPKQIGWSLMHSYRGKNGFGALTLNQTKFYFDKNLTKIDSVSK